jgi:hypothetical protein
MMARVLMYMNVSLQQCAFCTQQQLQAADEAAGEG